MKIEKFQVSNFKSFKDLNFDFKKINVILGPNNSGKSNILKFLLLLKQTFLSSLHAPLILNGNIFNFGSYKNITFNFNSDNIEIYFKLIIDRKDIRPFFARFLLLDKKRSKSSFSVKLKYSYLEKINKIKIQDFILKDLQNNNKLLDYHKDVDTKLKNKTTQHYIENFKSNLDELIKILGEIPKFKIKRKQSIMFRRFSKTLKDKLKSSDCLPLINYFRDELRAIRKDEFSIGINEETNFPTIDTNITTIFLDEIEIEDFFEIINRYLIKEFISKPIECENMDILRKNVSNIVKILKDLKKIQNNIQELANKLIILKTYMIDYFKNVFYIGPLRNIPQRYYSVIGELAKDVGIRGEFAHLVLKTSFEDKSYKDLFEKLQYWLESFEMAKTIKIKSYKEITEFISIMFKEYFSGINVNITDMGIGTSQVFPIILEGFLIEPNSVLLIEQPEIHLHPKAQSILGDLFIDIAQERKTLIVETHSEHLIQRIQRRIAEGKISPNDVVFYYVTMTDDGSQIEVLNIDEDGYIKNIPDGFFDEDYKEAFNHMNVIIDKSKNKDIN